jgi:hypothetical protein
MRFHAYSFQLIVDVGDAQGLGFDAAPPETDAASRRWAQPVDTTIVSTTNSTGRERIRVVSMVSS